MEWVIEAAARLQGRGTHPRQPAAALCQKRGSAPVVGARRRMSPVPKWPTPCDALRAGQHAQGERAAQGKHRQRAR